MFAARLWDSLIVCADAETEVERIMQREDTVIRKERIKAVINRFHSSVINLAP